MIIYIYTFISLSHLNYYFPIDFALPELEGYSSMAGNLYYDIHLGRNCECECRCRMNDGIEKTQGSKYIYIYIFLWQSASDRLHSKIYIYIARSVTLLQITLLTTFNGSKLANNGTKLAFSEFKYIYTILELSQLSWNSHFGWKINYKEIQQWCFFFKLFFIIIWVGDMIGKYICREHQSWRLQPFILRGTNDFPFLLTKLTFYCKEGG